MIHFLSEKTVESFLNVNFVVCSPNCIMTTLDVFYILQILFGGVYGLVFILFFKRLVVKKTASLNL